MGDLISRQAAIDSIVNTVSRVGLHDNSEVARYGAAFRQHEIIDIIEALPSAEPEWEKGKWLMHSDFPDRLICSECGAQFDVWHWESKQMHFCPNCGKGMRGIENETD